MTTLGEAVAQFGNNPRGGAETVAEALRVPKAVVEEAMIAPQGRFASMDVSYFQVSPMDANGMDPNVVAYLNGKFAQWKGSVHAEFAKATAEFRTTVLKRLEEQTDRIVALECDLSAARLRNARLHDEVDALNMALGGAQTIIAAGDAKAVEKWKDDQVESMAICILGGLNDCPFSVAKDQFEAFESYKETSLRVARLVFDHLEYL